MEEYILSREGEEEGRLFAARNWKSFTPYIALFIALLFLISFLTITLMNTRLIHKEIRVQAETLLESIILARRWNASFGGVFVEKKGDVKSNPYIKDPDISTLDGRMYTLRNPAMMTREISMLAKNSGFFEFTLTSLKPLNPSNRPDDFERRALLDFEKGTEIVEETLEGPKLGQFTYNYMVPLYTEKICLKCHDEQGYKVGDVRGGIRIRFDITDVKRALFWQKTILWLLILAISANIVSVLYFLTHRRTREEEEKQPH